MEKETINRVDKELAGSTNSLVLGDGIDFSLMHGGIFEEDPAKITWVKTHNDAGGYYARGVIFDYIHMNKWGQTQCCRICPWEMGVPGGAYKEPNYGWARYGYTDDTKEMTHSYNNIGPSIIDNDETKIFLAGFVIYSGNEAADANGFINVSDKPIHITITSGQKNRFDFTEWMINESSVEMIVTKDELVITKFKPNIWLIRTNIDGNMNKPDVIEYCRDASFVLKNVDYYTSPKYNVANEECWNAYMGSKHVYHKNKTVENCWLKYGLATKKQYTSYWNIVIDGHSAKDYSKYYIDLVTDLNYYLTNADGSEEHPYIKMTCTPTNTDVPEAIAAYYAEHYAPSDAYNCQMYGSKDGGLFLNAQLDEISIKLGTDNEVSKDYMTLNAAFNNCAASTINIDLKEDCHISSPQQMFYHCINLKTINYTGNPCGAYDCSGMFELCSKLTTYPSNLIDWSVRSPRYISGTSNVYYDTNMCYFMDNCPSLISIPAYTGGTRDNNTIIIGSWCEQMISNSPNLIEIGPILDFRYVNPDIGAARDCLDCHRLISAKIKNLNHGNWDFTGTHGNLTSLDASSIEYLIDNLTDLTDSNYEDWDPAKPAKTSATLTVPNTWELSVQQTNLALAKGWTIIQR